MRQNQNLLICAVIILFNSSLTIASDTTDTALSIQTETDVHLESNIDAFLSPLIEADLISGSLLIAKGNRVIIDKGFGLADRDRGYPNTSSTSFRIASISKSITAVAVMQLVDRGVLSLDTSLESLIPGFEHGEQITIANLLEHTSGIPSDVYLEEFREHSVAGMSLFEAVEWIKEAPPRFYPGERFEYSNSGFLILSAIIEIVSGVGFEQFVQKNVFSPAGMTHSGLDSERASSPGTAKGYSREEGGAITETAYRNPSYGWGYGALFSSTGDLFAFDKALVNNVLLSTESRKLMWSERSETPWGNKYGLGWFINDLEGEKVITALGSTGGFVGTIRHFVSRDLLIVVLLNRDFMLDSELYEQLSRIALGKPWTPLIEPNTEAELDQFVQFLGTYEMDDGEQAELKLEEKRLVFGGVAEKPSDVTIISESIAYIPARNARLIFVRKEDRPVELISLYGNLAWRGVLKPQAK